MKTFTVEKVTINCPVGSSWGVTQPSGEKKIFTPNPEPLKSIG